MAATIGAREARLRRTTLSDNCCSLSTRLRLGRARLVGRTCDSRVRVVIERGYCHCAEVPRHTVVGASCAHATAGAAFGRYSAIVSSEFNEPGATAPVPGGSGAPSSTPRRSSNSVVGWLIAAVVVLVLAVAGGLFTAWIVANMQAVPGPVAAASPTPGRSAPSASSCACTPSPGASVQASSLPAHTPTPAPTVEVTPVPFVYTVVPGDHLVNIANLYQVSLQDVMALNNITNPNKIFVGEQLLIPGYGIPPPTKKPK